MILRRCIGLTTRILLLFSWILMTGCDVTFNPVQENDKYHFSIFGYLDASADTQWVRVMPVRDSLSPDTNEISPLDAVVTLEHMESGERSVLTDSLFSLPHGVNVWNYWTTMDVRPKQTYRLMVDGSDGRTSHVAVSLPEDIPTPYFRSPLARTLFIGRVKRLVDVQTIYYLQFAGLDTQLRVSFPHLQDTLQMQSGDIVLNMGGDPLADFGHERVTHAQIFVAVGGPDYLDYGSIDERVEAIPNAVSNIVNGTGYLAGIVSKTIPYRTCIEPLETGEQRFVPCPLESSPW